MEDCFEGIICFETLNPTNKGNIPADEDGTESRGRPRTTLGAEILDANEDLPHPNANPVFPRTPVVCKPFEDAYEKVFNIANINPQKTVRSLKSFLPIIIISHQFLVADYLSVWHLVV